MALTLTWYSRKKRQMFHREEVGWLIVVGCWTAPSLIRLILVILILRGSSLLGLVGSLLLLVLGLGLLMLGDVGSLLLVRVCAPLLTEETSELAEGGLGVLGLDLLAPLLTEEEVGGHRVLGCVGVLLGLSLSLLRLLDLGPL